jgi:signal transduction histidine kinase/ligand-binding sensor domain-containing protein
LQFFQSVNPELIKKTNILKFPLQLLLLFVGLLTLHIDMSAQGNLPKFRHFGVEEGLSTSSVTRICQDLEGKIWVGTHDGLNCFYGTFFKSFFQDRTRGKGLNQSAISDLICDKNGILWIASYGGGINLLDPVSQQFLPVPKSITKLNWTQVNCLAEDKSGKIWIGSYEGLSVYNPLDQSLKTVSVLQKTNRPFSISHIAFDPRGYAFVSTPFEGLFVMSCDNDLKFEAMLTYETLGYKPKGLGLFNTLSLQNQMIEGCTQLGLFNFRFKSGQIFWQKIDAFASKTKGSKEVKCTLKDAFGRKWIANGDSGFSLFSAKNEEIPVNLPYKGKFFNAGIVDFFQDRWGGIWIGSSHGLSYTNPQLSKFQSFANDKAIGLGGFNVTWSIYTENDIEFLLGSESGLFSFNANTYEMEKIDFVDFNQNYKVYCFLKTKAGELLAGSSQGVYKIEKEGKRYILKRILPEVPGMISSMVQLSDGTILIGTYDERGLFKISSDFKQVTKFTNEPLNHSTIANNSINILQIGIEGKVWIGTDKGLSLFDPSNNKFDNSIWDLIPKDKNISQLIYGIIDFKSELWLGTFGSGILVFDKERREFKQIGLDQGFLNESIYQLQKQNNRVWASTNKGLCLIEKGGKDIRVFTVGDGLQSNEYNHFASFKNSGSGKIYFGGLAGFDEVSSFLRPENNILPKVILSEAKLLLPEGEKNLSLQSAVWELQPEEQNLELEFSALNYLMPEKSRYAYQISGKNNRRISLGEKNKLTLVNLQPGEFTIKIFASNNEGIWSIKPFEVKVIVHPHFWKTLWFKALVALVLIGILLGAIRFYIRSRLRVQRLALEKQQAVRLERNRISAEMHDDLGSGLTSIKMLSELIKLKSPKEPLPELLKIANRSDELIDSLNTIVWALNDRNDRLEHMVAYFRAFVQGEFEERNFDLKTDFQITDGVESIEISGEFRRNIFLILKESIHNVFKHSGATLTTVSFYCSKEGMELTVQDNGKGLDFGNKSFGNGLKNMKARALALGGSISFESENGLAMKFKISKYN